MHDRKSQELSPSKTLRMKDGYRERKGWSSWRGCTSQCVWGCFREDRGKNGSEVKLWRKEGIPISRHDAKRTVRKDGLRKEDTEAEPPGWIARGGGPGRGVWV